MLSAGNGTAQQCARNLLSMVRGECPYERCKGIDPDLTDAPLSGAFGMIAEEVQWVLKNYEPRVTQEDASLIAEAAFSGDFRTVAAIRTA